MGLKSKSSLIITRLCLASDHLRIRHLIIATTALHVILAISIFAVGRMQLAPRLVDRDGIMPSFAFDSYQYQSGASSLSRILESGGLTAWITAREPIHVKIISISFVVLGPLFGYGPLSAEPFNVLCYVSIVCLVFLIGREMAGRRVGVFSAITVALWPTLLLHSLQLLKDPLVIAGVSGLFYWVATLLTRTYGWRTSAIAAATTTAAVVLISIVRFPFALLIVALVLLGVTLLLLRQLLEKRFLVWNFLCPLPALLMVAVIVSFHGTHESERLKLYPSTNGGESKLSLETKSYVPGTVMYLRHIPKDGWKSGQMDRLIGMADFAVLRISSIRSRFTATYPTAGSAIDRDLDFRTLRALVFYLPRAFEIGLWAPFPDTWTSAGQRTGEAGRLVSAGETLLIYVCELLALFAVVQSPRNLAVWLLLMITVLGVTALGVVVPNLGALYRFRYPLWLLLIVLGMKGLQSLVRARKPQLIIALAGLLLCSYSCSSIRPSSTHEANTSSGSQISDVTSDPLLYNSKGKLDFQLVNFTGNSLNAVYISPSESPGWQENIIDGISLADGDRVTIRFSPSEHAVLWDMKVVGAESRYSEWKSLNLTEISRIVLRLRSNPGLAVVAEVE